MSQQAVGELNSNNKKTFAIPLTHEKEKTPMAMQKSKEHKNCSTNINNHHHSTALPPPQQLRP
jgi:hypothetical protein